MRSIFNGVKKTRIPTANLSAAEAMRNIFNRAKRAKIPVAYPQVAEAYVVFSAELKKYEQTIQLFAEKMQEAF